MCVCIKYVHVYIYMNIDLCHTHTQMCTEVTFKHSKQAKQNTCGLHHNAPESTHRVINSSPWVFG